MNNNLRSPAATVMLYIWLAIAAIFIIFPVLYAVIGSFRSTADIQGGVQSLFFGEWIFTNFPRAWEQSSIGSQLINSVIVTIAQTAGQFITSVLAAYALVFGRIRGANKWLIIFLLPMMIPSEVAIIGNYLTVRSLGFYDTVIGIFIPYLASSFSLFLFYQAFKGFPKEIWEAVRLEGVGPFRFLYMFLLPLNRSVAMTVIVTSAIAAWNGYMWPLLITESEAVRTIQPGIKSLADEASVDQGLVLAGLIMAVIPTVLLVILGQKYLTRGLTDGAVK